MTALLTLFNARLGAWLGNPKKDSWKNFGPQWGLLYLASKMLGRTNDQSDYVYVSDGGHFEDLGVYELVRRRCRFIVVCDGGADPKFTLKDLGNMIRKVRIDFGVPIEIDLEALRPRGDDRRSGSHVAVGKIRYGDVDGDVAPDPSADADPTFHPDRDEGLLVYIKAGLTGDEPPDLLNYAAEHPDFPNQSTLNQFFTESQFESYRALGYHSAVAALGDAIDRPGRAAATNREFFAAVYDLWYPPPPDFTRNYIELNRDYVAVQEALRTEPQLRFLSAELFPEDQGNQDLLGGAGGRRTPEVRNGERHMILQMLTVLENSWFGLHLDRYRRHPVHNGWMEVYRRWLTLPAVRANWESLKSEFSHVFQQAVEDLLAEERRWAVEAETLPFEGPSIAERKRRLHRFLRMPGGLGSPADLVAAAAAVRAFVAVLRPEELGAVGHLLDAGTHASVPLEIELEAAKMTVRKLTAVAAGPDSEPALGDRLTALIRKYLTADALSEPRRTAVALNSVLSLALLDSLHLDEVGALLKKLNVPWFKQLLGRRARQLREEIGGRVPSNEGLDALLRILTNNPAP